MDTPFNDSLLLREVLRTVESIGIDKTIEVLADGRSLKFGDPRVDFVVKMTTGAFKITPHDVILTRNDTIAKKLSMQFSVYYLHDKDEGFAMPCRAVASALKRDNALMVNYYHDMISKKNDKTDEACVRYFNMFSPKVMEYKKFLKNLIKTK